MLQKGSTWNIPERRESTAFATEDTEVTKSGDGAEGVTAGSTAFATEDTEVTKNGDGVEDVTAGSTAATQIDDENTETGDNIARHLKVVGGAGMKNGPRGRWNLVVPGLERSLFPTDSIVAGATCGREALFEFSFFDFF